jgi:peroxiredoxin
MGRFNVSTSVAVMMTLLLLLTGCSNSRGPEPLPTSSIPATPAAGDVSSPGDAPTSQMAPQVTFTDMSGESVTMASLRGGVVVVYFWATYCIPCIEKLPRMQAIHEAYRNKGVKIWALSLDGDADVVAGWLEKQDLTIPVGLVDDEMREKFFPGKKIVSIPQTLLIDDKGHIAAWLGAEMTIQELEESIKALLGD